MFPLNQQQSIDLGILEPLKRPFQNNSNSIESIWTQPQYQNTFDPVVAQGGFQPVAPPKATSYIQANHESSKKDDRSNTTQPDMLRGFEGLRVSQPQHGHLPMSQQYASYHVPLATQSMPRDQKQVDHTYADTWSANQYGKGSRPHVGGPYAGGQVINRKSMAANNTFNYMPVQHQQSMSNVSSSYGRQLRDLENGFDGYQVQKMQHYQQQPYTQTYYPSNINIPTETQHGHYGYSGTIDAPGMTLELANDGQNDTNHIYRSPLLEDFRINKAKKYELKDIYGHIVEFSGDQLGSRFIQQKLEVATSDEKDRVFNEIAQDSRQLMTDVFGNYVIQKMFEHGNQPQKKLLASHMKGHVYALSTQVYGCRVVQKALEYILTDQQASLIKELDGCVLKVVEDQNGNHVIQKAIERIPGEHIQFIVDAHRGHVHYLSKHSYGCRVIQRMLEHCTPRAKRQILVELHMNISDLIQDAFGNYVVQHVIANGEAQDRKPVIDKVMSRLLENATHKFASNVVEKALDYADDEQRRTMLRKLTVRDETGQSQSSKLLSHQYGNYVIRKCLQHEVFWCAKEGAEKSGAHLQGHTLASLIEEMEQYLLQLRRVSTGKQVTAFENTIREARHRLDRQGLEDGIHSAPTQPRTRIARR